MSKMRPRSLRSKCFSPGKGSWYDPEQLGLKVILALLYMAGLVSFQRYTGLLNTPSSSSISSTTKIHSSEEALHWLRNYDINSGHSRLIRSLMALPEEANGTDFLSSNSSTNSTNGTMIEINQADPLFPPDLFTMEQIKGGYVAFYIVGVVYMFVALAIVCDEFFVPSLDVIIEQIGCSEDVAGATFMAAGGSAPELFTSVIGVFIAFSDVGIGTIVGSAVFNILFVIGMCALFSKTVLCLTWWPLLRDCTFYSISLLTLIAFFLDERIEMYEAAILLAIYGFYVFFMKYNVKAEVGFKRLIGANKVHETQLMNNTSNGQGHIGYSGVPVLHSGSHFHHGLLQLMIHTIDPLSEGGSQSRVNEKAAQLHAIASIQSILGSAAAGGMAPADGVNGNNPRNTSTNLGPELSQFDAFTNADQLSQIGVTINEPVKSQANADLNGLNVAPMEEEEESEPLDMSWPDTWSKRLSYVLVLPLILPMWITLPDTRKPNLRGFYPITFIGSILWIAVFSYLMVWWSTITGEAFSIPPEVMGLTFLAAGTSIPDLFTSVIVARKGFGDMAVSSSVGSNIFDVTVGLPLPWLLYTLVFQKDVAVSAAGLVCSVTILFMMLIAVFLSILLFSWKMTKTMGLSMFVFYFLFVIATLGFEYDFYECPF